MSPKYQALQSCKTESSAGPRKIVRPLASGLSSKRIAFHKFTHSEHDQSVLYLPELYSSNRTRNPKRKSCSNLGPKIITWLPTSALKQISGYKKNRSNKPEGQKAHDGKDETMNKHLLFYFEK
ncbi:uncharacterized protein EAF01_005059 [Botrytis porri]|uniref:uncharacterized protein n=1 Tax=Botrytis porri TaxID=87229 RepID=UPI0019009579|nr:uncharacterized protein EAF01_005059 [Botrytis porri]KAF7907473.1 hypothetical protein EAF01_005059 [Botrytis porri]